MIIVVIAKREERKMKVGIGLFCAFVLGIAVAMTFAPDRHNHVPLGMDGWSNTQVVAFRLNSDRKIDEWAGRSVSPGEVVMFDGLPFRKSTSEDITEQRKCKWCPKREVCHD